MKQMLILLKRHIIIYFSNIWNIFFTCLSSIISLGVYLLFMFDSNLNHLTTYLPMIATIDIQQFMMIWLFSGQFPLIIFGATFNSMKQFLDDNKYNGSDLQVMPVKRYQLLLSYVLQSACIAIFIACFFLIIGLIFIYWQYGVLFTMLQLLQIIGCIFLLSFFPAMLAMFVAYFIHSQSTFQSVQTLLNTFMGFLLGIYIPLGELPAGLTKVLVWNPYLSVTTILRDICASEAFTTIFTGAPADTVANYRQVFGLTIPLFDGTGTEQQLLLYTLCCTVIIFIGVLYVSMHRK